MNSKLREVLDGIKNTACSALSVLSVGNCPAVSLWDIIRKCEIALAEPVRNCDVGTAEEQIERWRKFCHKFKQCDECPHMRNSELLSHGCFARWAQMPYEEGENDEQ